MHTSRQVTQSRRIFAPLRGFCGVCGCRCRCGVFRLRGEGRYGASIESRSTFPADVASAGEARRFVRQVLAEWSADSYVDAATLAVSELVTNAVLHARSGPVVTVRLDGGRLRVEVKDDSAVVPSRKRYGPEA